MPAYPGGRKAMSQFIFDNLKYPKDAIEKNTEGTVYVTFVVDKEGVVRNVKILRGIGDGCDEEAMRVVKAMPAWKPGKQEGKAVNVQFNLPLVFKLQKAEAEKEDK